MLHVIFGLLLAHIISDFYCQTNESCSKKKEGKKCVWIVHCGCVFVLSFIAIFTPVHWLGALVAALSVAVTHFLIDFIKVIYEKKKEVRESIWLFMIDQVVHLIVIFATSFFLFKKCQDYHCWLELIDIKIFLIILAFITVAKPVNIFVRLCLKYAKIYTDDESANNDESAGNDKFHSGKIIGTCERFIILLFVLLNQYEAIGFLVAAKSILRFGSTKESEKSEYVLAGTLLSIAIALVLGLIVVYRTAIGNFVNAILPFISY